MTRKNLLLSLTLASLAGCGAQPAPPAAPPAAPATSGFEKTLTWQELRFRVSSPNDSSLGTLTIVPTGLAGANDTLTREVDGTVVGAEIGDLDANGAPEVYVFVRSAGSGSYGSLVAFAIQDGRSLSEIRLPDIAEDPKLAQGYRGHDEFTITANALLRRFPVYADGDTNAAPSGGMRQLTYRLAAGQAGWTLQPAGAMN